MRKYREMKKRGNNNSTEKAFMRNNYIVNALIYYLIDTGVINEQELLSYCRNMDVVQLNKEIFRDDDASRSVNHEMHPGGSEAVFWLCDRMNISDKSIILDAGFGHGGVSALLVEHYDCDVIGIDNDYIRVLNAIFRNYDSRANGKIKLQYADAYHLSLEDNTFDAIIRQHAVYGDKEILFVRECYRILKDGGYIGVQGMCKSLSFVKDKKDFEDYTIEQYLDLLTEVGFQIVEVEEEQSTKDLMESFIKSNDKVRQKLVEKKMLKGIKIIAKK